MGVDPETGPARSAPEAAPSSQCPLFVSGWPRNDCYRRVSLCMVGLVVEAASALSLCEPIQ